MELLSAREMLKIAPAIIEAADGFDDYRGCKFKSMQSCMPTISRIHIKPSSKDDVEYSTTSTGTPIANIGDMSDEEIYSKVVPAIPNWGAYIDLDSDNLMAIVCDRTADSMSECLMPDIVTYNKTPGVEMNGARFYIPIIEHCEEKIIKGEYVLITMICSNEDSMFSHKDLYFKSTDSMIFMIDQFIKHGAIGLFFWNINSSFIMVENEETYNKLINYAKENYHEKYNA